MPQAIAGPEAPAVVHRDEQPEKPRPKLKLKPTPAEPPPKAERSLSEQELLREHLYGLRFKWRPDSEDDGFLADPETCNTHVDRMLEFVAKLEADAGRQCDRARARALVIQATVMFLRDDWPGKMDRLAPWSYRALLTQKSLPSWIAKARMREWKEPYPDDWEPLQQREAG